MTNKVGKYESGNYREYTIKIFPGIEIQHYFCEGGHVWHRTASTYIPNEDLLIHHCRYGRFEALLANGTYHSRGMGKMTISSSCCNLVEALIPAELYEGISIIFSYKQFPPWLAVLFSTWRIAFPTLVSGFNLSKRWYCIEANGEMEKIFLELYDLFDAHALPLIQLKVLELMYHVAAENALSGKDEKGAPQTHRTLVKKICTMMMHTTCPIAELVSQEAMNYNLFHKLFKSMYGTTPNLYRQEYKMNKAASLLKNTDRTVLDIALEEGYENPGKFAAAFKKVMGISPHEYRMLEK